MRKLRREIEIWCLCNPKAMSEMSSAAIFYAIDDAKHDITSLHSELSALREELASRNEVIAMKAREVMEAQAAVSDWARKCKAAEQRNADLESLLRTISETIPHLKAEVSDSARELVRRIHAVLAQPTESGASDKCTCIRQPQEPNCTDCPYRKSGASE